MGASFEDICVFHILDGLRDGLSHFSQPSRAALIYCVNRDGAPHIYDPQGLLRGHEPKLRAFFLNSDNWRQDPPEGTEVRFLEPWELKGLPLAGIIAYGGRSEAMAFQIWFTEEHPDMCSLGPTRRWLEYAARLFSQNFAMQNVLNMDIAGYALQKCANHAIRDHIVDERASKGAWDTHLRIYPILDAVLAVSATTEEGAWPRGNIVFVEPRKLGEIRFLATFDETERPALGTTKHVRKLLQSVEGSANVLVSDGYSIVGVGTGKLPRTSVHAEFNGLHGFLKLDHEPVCSFSDGSFHSSNLKPNLVQLEEALLETTLDFNTQHHLLQVVNRLVDRATERKHGCSIILDLGATRLSTAGQHLTAPLDLTREHMLDLACALSKVDGALHIGADLNLYGFACLMDGRAAIGENRARGARFNSAVRFTAEHERIIVVVVSADRPVSIIQGGVELTAACDYRQIRGCPVPPPLEVWLDGKDEDS